MVLMLNMRVLEEKTDMDLLVANNDKSNIIDVDDLDPKCQSLVIFDDSVTEKYQKKLKIYSS